MAAGSGARFGRPKHEVHLLGRPLWIWARDALLESGAREVVVVGPVPGGIEGGPERHVSVANGLARVGEKADLVAVHDAARPLAPVTMIKRMYSTLIDSRSDGVIPVVSIPDSIKRIHPDDGRLIETMSRSKVVAAQTPQVFRASILHRAYADLARSGSADPVPDDAALVERIGGKVVTVPGERTAMKITYPEDLALAETLARRTS